MMILRTGANDISSRSLHFLVLSQYCPLLADTLLANFPFLANATLYFCPKAEGVSWHLENGFFDYIYLMDRNIEGLFQQLKHWE